ncbi:hypothetical protein IQ268_28680 [Oculatella sp. LEGE 06141]|uniref:hypothetical protein n=1 Tax=Oculatella sp. LEGE 06141 TaxID=1828648 RepID=UPI00187EEAB0|nr:hypothetical protein [Oculatella sp. LEGE 06141]MBE9182530.1 hypothetical protein [Oculatella sp. LEGE 06141]
MTKQDRLNIDLKGLRERIENFRDDPAWKALSMSKKIRLLIEMSLNDHEVQSSATSSDGEAPKSLQQLVLRNWAVLAENSGVDLERLKLLRDGQGEPSEVEVLRIALALTLSESFVSSLPLKNGGKQTNGIT